MHGKKFLNSRADMYPLPTINSVSASIQNKTNDDLIKVKRQYPQSLNCQGNYLKYILVKRIIFGL